jgi:hypothetical protein
MVRHEKLTGVDRMTVKEYEQDLESKSPAPARTHSQRTILAKTLSHGLSAGENADSEMRQNRPFLEMWVSW